MDLLRNSISSRYHLKLFFGSSALIVLSVITVLVFSWRADSQLQKKMHYSDTLINIQRIDLLVKESWIKVINHTEEQNKGQELSAFINERIEKIAAIKQQVLKYDANTQEEQLKNAWQQSLDNISAHLKLLQKNKVGNTAQSKTLLNSSYLQSFHTASEQLSTSLEKQRNNVVQNKLIQKLYLYPTLSIFLIIAALAISLIFYYLAQKYMNKFQRVLNILHNYPEPLYIVDHRERFTYLNKAMEALYKLSGNEIIGKTRQELTSSEKFSTIISDDASTDSLIVIEAESNQSNPQNVEHVQRHYLLSSIPYQEISGHSYTCVMAKDVTDLTQAKNESQKNQTKLQNVLDVSQEGMWEYNLRTSQCFFDSKCLQIFGWDEGLHDFSEFENSIIDEDKEKVSNEIEQLLIGSAPFDSEYRILKGNGDVIWIWDRCMVIERDEHNKPLVLVGIVQDITQDKINQDKINSLAFYDPLTGLPNRTLLTERLQQAILLSTKRNSFSAVFLLDLDRFKIINDTYGHQMGDQLLIEVAKRIKSALHEEDTVARFGGDEFVVIVNHLGSSIRNASAKARKIATKIKDTLALSMELKEPASTPLNYFTTTSIGGVIFKTDSHDMNTLLKLSDVALYKVKQRGGNDYMLVDPELQNQLNETADMYKSLRMAIDENELSLYYQPKYTADREVIGAEALLRWNNKKFGMVSPVKFIPLAEESNLIIEMGYWVLTQACQQLELWSKDPALSQLQLSINLSAKQIWQEDFIFLAKNIINYYNFDASKLTFEVTESILIRDVSGTIKKLTALQEMGSRISLDDFGTGYSSLSYLKSFPIDELKIDRSFIRDINVNKSDLIMVKSMIELGENFGLQVISEGVEDNKQLETLIKLGCNQFQGFYFNRPLALNDFLKEMHK